MIRSYRDTDLGELLETWYSASLLAHPFLDEAFFQQERKMIREVHTLRPKPGSTSKMRW